MKARLKKLNEQVMVITGATSGIGLATARLAAKQGVRLVLNSRSEDALKELTTEINSKGGEAIFEVGDTGREEDIKRLANRATQHYGGFDTWVNNAGVSVYGRLDQVPTEDLRKVFETNVWGVVYGSLAALSVLRSRGGALINIGSVVSDRAMPLQGIYSASKHAVKAFTDALRMELEEEGAPVSVTLIKPGAIDTPYPHHAANYMNEEPTHPSPAYAPEVVARAILYAAERPVRDVVVGGGGKVISAGSWMPRLMDRFQELTAFKSQRSGKAPYPQSGKGLYEGSSELAERGGFDGHVMESSLYTWLTLHPLAAGAAVLGLSMAVGSLFANGSVASRRERMRGGFQPRRRTQYPSESEQRDAMDELYRSGSVGSAL